MSTITVARALTARMARRLVNIATIVAIGVFLILILATWILAHLLSVWWWLLLIPIVALVMIFTVIRLIAGVILSRIHTGTLTKEQSSALDDFIEKVEQAIEARATPLPIVAIICIKDIVFHRDITTVKKIINDTVGLRNDYKQLETLFN